MKITYSGAAFAMLFAAIICSGCDLTVKITYHGNGHTSGTVPGDMADYKPLQSIAVLDNS
jgi:hypothetical protein